MPAYDPFAAPVKLPGLVEESGQDAITAHSGGGQTSAYQLVADINRVTVVAVAGDSVKLPPSSPGMDIVVINSAANPVQVYGSGTDTINDVATATGVSQMPNSDVLYACTVAGKWYANGIGTGFSGSLSTVSATDAITASVTHSQAGGVPITTSISRVTVASANDALTLPVSAPGMVLTVINATANTINIYPNAGGTTTETINALSANSSITLATVKVMTFYCTVAGQWHTLLSA